MAYSFIHFSLTYVAEMVFRVPVTTMTRTMMAVAFFILTKVKSLLKFRFGEEHVQEFRSKK